MLRLYDYYDSGNGYKVRLLLAQLGIAYEYIEKDIMKGETRAPEFLALNPNGRIPVLQLEDGTALAESNAILFYLAEGTPYLPADRLDRARVLQWLFFEQYSHEPYIAVARFLLRHTAADDPRRGMLEQRQKGGYAALDVMEGHLAERLFFVAGRYSIADIALYAYTHVADQGGFELGSYPALRAWLARVEAQPGYVRMLPRPGQA
ncbi:MAG TPA: glutathione S-transferase family protein [Alphaproteobacteria bacterium]|nr:glutathione S-transferase family protein [Alphaproteobacteria bacterium]